MKINSEKVGFTRIFPKKIVKKGSRAKSTFETGYFTHESDKHICYISQRFLREASEGLYVGEVLIKRFKNLILVEKTMAILISTLDEYCNHLYQYNLK